MIISTVGTNMVYLDNWLITIRIMSKLDKKSSFLVKFMKIEFYGYLKIRSCLSNSYSL